MQSSFGSSANDTIHGPYQRLFAGQLAPALFEGADEEKVCWSQKTYSALESFFDKLDQDNKDVVDQKPYFELDCWICSLAIRIVMMTNSVDCFLKRLTILKLFHT